MKHKIYEGVMKGLRIGLTVAGAYTGAYICIKKQCCSVVSEDPIMRGVRGVTGALIGASLGYRTAADVDLMFYSRFPDMRFEPDKVEEDKDAGVNCHE